MIITYDFTQKCIKLYSDFKDDGEEKEEKE